MAAHINITGNFTSAYGLTLETGAEAEDVQDTSTITLAELVDQSSGEVVKVSATHLTTRNVVITGEGPANLTDPAAGTVGNSTTLNVISAEISEAPNQRCRFSITLSGTSAFTDPAGTVSATGAAPTIDDLEITSVEYTIAESVRRTYAVTDLVLAGTNGEPAARAKVGRVGTFSVQGRGDLPAGVALGTGGSSFTGGDTGIVMVSSLVTGERRRDWNRWGADGSHYESAA